MSFHSLLSKTKTTGRRKHQEIITSLWVFIFVFFSSSSSFHYLLSKTKTKNHKRKKKKKKKKERRGATGRSCPGNQKKKIIIIIIANRQRPNQKEKNNNNNKEEGIGIVQYLQTKPKRKKEKKEATDWTSPCTSTHGYFHHLTIKFLLLSFLPILKRKYFVGLREKTSGPYQFFFSPLP